MEVEPKIEWRQEKELPDRREGASTQVQESLVPLEWWQARAKGQEDPNNHREGDKTPLDVSPIGKYYYPSADDSRTKVDNEAWQRQPVQPLPEVPDYQPRPRHQWWQEPKSSSGLASAKPNTSWKPWPESVVPMIPKRTGNLAASPTEVWDAGGTDTSETGRKEAEEETVVGTISDRVFAGVFDPFEGRSFDFGTPFSFNFPSFSLGHPTVNMW